MRFITTVIVLFLFSYYFKDQPVQSEPVQKIFRPQISMIDTIGYYSDRDTSAILNKIKYIKSKYGRIVHKSSLIFHVPKELIYSIIFIESSGNHLAVGKDGEIGLMQLLPATAQIDKNSLLDPEINILAGTKYLKQILDNPKENKLRYDKIAIRYNSGYYAYDCGNRLNGNTDNVLNKLLESNNLASYNYVLKLLGKNGILKLTKKLNV